MKAPAKEVLSSARTRPAHALHALRRTRYGSDTSSVASQTSCALPRRRWRSIRTSFVDESPSKGGAQSG
eukprot:5828143-Alexandrium_andersonii.AAC.1